MFDKLAKLEKRFERFDELMCKPETIADQELYKKSAKGRAEIEDVVTAYRKYRKIKKEMEDNQSLIDEGEDAELSQVAEDENKNLKTELAQTEKELKLLLVPKDPDDMKNLIMEIRAGTGGDEAGLFAAELHGMYMRFAANKGFKTETMSLSQAQGGGIKEVIVSVQGKNAYGILKYESGTHRVQRVPKTESQGRIHTSAVTVAVLPEVEEKEVQLNPQDIKIDVFRASGPGGQSVNTTDSAVRITHFPTGIMVSMQDEKSQIKNRAKAMKVLLSRVQNHYAQKEKDKQTEVRRLQVGTGDRSEKIRTYNFPQSRVTDHRINFSVHNLDEVMQGEIDELMEKVRQAAQAEQLTAEGVELSEGGEGGGDSG